MHVVYVYAISIFFRKRFGLISKPAFERGAKIVIILFWLVIAMFTLYFLHRNPVNRHDTVCLLARLLSMWLHIKVKDETNFIKLVRAKICSAGNVFLVFAFPK